MRNFKLVCEYDGALFHGWQMQPALRTVQGELARCIEEITGERVRVTGAGRTDAGVHAVGQTANFLSATALSPAVLKRGLNARLPKDIRVTGIEEVPLDFSARFDARSRTYRYIFIRRQTALWRAHYYHVRGALDPAAMSAALRAIEGERDFSSFCSAEEASPHRRCRVISTSLIETPPLLAVEITADHFLHKMVRMIAGTVLEAGRGKRVDMREILEARDRSRSGPALPPYALYLVSVAY